MNVLQDRLGFVLGQDVDGVDARVDKIAEDKINDAIPAPKRDRRLGAMTRQRLQAVSTTTCQDKGENADRWNHERFSGQELIFAGDWESKSYSLRMLAARRREVNSTRVAISFVL
jgi:hypothetical protein